jgi:hypothetical protein
VEQPNFPEVPGYQWKLSETSFGHLQLYLMDEDSEDWLRVEDDLFAAGGVPGTMCDGMAVEVVRTFLDVAAKIPWRSSAVHLLLWASWVFAQKEHPSQCGVFATRGFSACLNYSITDLREEIPDLDPSPADDNTEAWRQFLKGARQRILDRERARIKEVFG